jgi:hypothetical protein
MDGERKVRILNWAWASSQILIPNCSNINIKHSIILLAWELSLSLNKTETVI